MKAPTDTKPRRSTAGRQAVPSLAFERLQWEAGNSVVVGIDEVGRGSWAGPLTVGAAVLPPDKRVNKVRDSKMLSESVREAMFDRVASWCAQWSVGHASPEECDQLGMAQAQRVAAARAIDALGVTPDAVLLDGNWDFVGHPNTTTIIKGDQKSLSIAAASILAKVTRDRIMRSASSDYPFYGFESNKGYPCPRHKAALQAYGPSLIHRKRWAFMSHIPFGSRATELDDLLADGDGHDGAQEVIIQELDLR